MESGGGFARKVSGGVDVDLLVERNPGTVADRDSSEEGPTPHPEVEGSLSISSSSCGRSGRALSSLTSAVLEA